MGETLAKNLAFNIRALREKRGLSQQQIAHQAEIPRPTWANLESGEANPTVSVLTRVANALDVGVEQLLAPVRDSARVFRASELPTHKKGKVTIRSLTPNRLAGLALERMTFAPGGQLRTPELPPNTRHMLTCEQGELEANLGGHVHSLRAGDVLQYAATDRCLLRNTSDASAVAFSIVAFRYAE